MEVFGAAAAAFTLGAELLRLSRSLRKMIKGIKYARRDIAKLADEMGIFAGLYEDFLRVCVIGDQSTSRMTSPIMHLIAWTKDAHKSFKMLLHRVRALARDSSHSWIETVAAHVKWYFSEHDVKSLRLSLNVARESMRGFSNISIVEKLDKEIDMLRTAILRGNREATELSLGMSLEDKMYCLKQLRSVPIMLLGEP
jgi:hypothetical protein